MYQKRIKIFLAVMAAVLLVLAVRIAHLQIVRCAGFRAEFEKSIRDVQLLPAARGQITDRAGRILAVDLPCKDFCLDYRFLTADPEWKKRQCRAIRQQAGVGESEAQEIYGRRSSDTWKMANELAQKADVDLGETVDQIVSRVGRIRQAVLRRGALGEIRVAEERESHPVVKAMEDTVALRVEEDIRRGKTIGASLRPSQKRYYPYGDLACHVIGLMGAVTPADLERLNPPREGGEDLLARREAYEPDDSLGIAGVEKMCEPVLRGTRGYRLRETGGPAPVDLAGEPARAGGDVHTTLDIELQKLLADEIRRTGHHGAAVILSVAQGDVLAMVSVPTYDLNRYREDYAKLSTDELDVPLMNRAVTRLYPPGSSAKPITALAALATGRITTGTTVDCAGHFYANRPDELRCTGRHGAVDLHRGIMKSCNVYFYHLGEWLTLPALCEWYRLFGLHEPVGTGLPEEKPGHVPSPAWIADPRNRAALSGEALQDAIGQGTILATPAHIANVMATIARDGRLVSPMLVLEGRPERTVRDLPIPAAALKAVREGMRDVVGSPEGTAYKAFHPPGGLLGLGVDVCAKTGTAQTEPQRMDLNHDGRIEPGEIVREGKMAWCAGFAPAGRPRIAFAVVLEYVTEGGGGSNAGPVARELVRYCKELGYLKE